MRMVESPSFIEREKESLYACVCVCWRHNQRFEELLDKGNTVEKLLLQRRRQWFVCMSSQFKDKERTFKEKLCLEERYVPMFFVVVLFPHVLLVLLCYSLHFLWILKAYVYERMLCRCDYNCFHCFACIDNVCASKNALGTQLDEKWSANSPFWVSHG